MWCPKKTHFLFWRGENPTKWGRFDGHVQAWVVVHPLLHNHLGTLPDIAVKTKTWKTSTKDRPAFLVFWWVNGPITRSNWTLYTPIIWPAFNLKPSCNTTIMIAMKLILESVNHALMPIASVPRCPDWKEILLVESQVLGRSVPCELIQKSWGRNTNWVYIDSHSWVLKRRWWFDSWLQLLGLLEEGCWSKIRCVVSFFSVFFFGKQFFSIKVGVSLAVALNQKIFLYP